MKTSFKYVGLLTLMLAFFVSIPEANAQLLKKLKKRAEKAAEEAVLRKTEEKVYKETSEKVDEVLNPGDQEETNSNTSEHSTSGNKNPQQNTDQSPESTHVSGHLKVYSKFDFVPGDKLLLYDDFSLDFIGDFPSKWNTNGSGEVVSINDTPDKWLKILPGYNTFYIPDVTLPEEYTIEFDLLTSGLDKHTPSTAVLRILLSNDTSFKWGSNYVNAEIPFCQYAAIGIRMKNHINNKVEINNVVTADLREAVLNKPHISIAVNKQRYRLWVNEKKYIDIPRIVPSGGSITALKFALQNFKDGKERLFIGNLKIAEGGVDLRRKLISEGKVSTNGILFNSGSAQIKPQSYGIIRQISQVLLQDKTMKLRIIGHTDSDGTDEANMLLSSKRSAAVKDALISIYGISADRISTSGKGESEPVADNTTSDGKAQNRRVEFVKM